MSITQWAAIYRGCTRFTMNGPQRWAWPDGRSYMEQPSLAVEMFEILDYAVIEETSED